MELNIKDRLYIPVILPKEGTFKDFNTKKEILRKIEISAGEREAVGLHENEENGRIEWDIEKDTPLAFDFAGDEIAGRHVDGRGKNLRCSHFPVRL